MMELLFPLEIFPQGSLSSSVITTVWVGVFVVAFFNLKFGWALSGLVVPGYLVPLLLIKPWAVLAILIEGVTAYYLIWIFSQYLSRYGLWSALFGRDRFFALLLASIVTRVTFDGWILPSLGLWLQDYGVVFDYRNELHSLGLVIVTLVANQFWKTGVIRGMPPFIITLLVTWLIVKFVLISFTNFGLSGLSYMYEDLAASILASPKAYIILVTTAFVASRMNLKYGWDFNGILIPALLALQWYEPTKILISFMEAFIILGLAIVTLKVPIFANMSIEGARKLLLFFNIAFIYKLLLAYVMFYLTPEEKVSDYFAFGYLLSTLMAIKMHDKGIAIHLTRATLQTSIVSIFIASVVGYSLTILPNFQTWAIADKVNDKITLVNVKDTLLERLQKIKPQIYGSRYSDTNNPLPLETDYFLEASTLLLKYVRTGNTELLNQGVSLFHRLDFQVELLQKQYLIISDTSSSRNWGYYVLNLKADNDLLIELPSPLEDRGLVEGAGALFITLNARSLAISGTSTQKFLSQTLFDGFHRVAGRHNVLQVHSYTKEIERSLDLIKHDTQNKNKSTVSGELWIKKRLPPGLDMSKLQRVVGEYDINWGETQYSNPQRDTSRDGYGEIILNRKGLRRLLIGPLLNSRAAELKIGDQRIEGYIQEWLLGRKGQIAARGSDSYITPKIEELIYLDEEVLTPIVSNINSGYKDGQWTAESQQELQIINAAASVLGYELSLYRHHETKDDYLILSESNQKTRRYWGTYIFRLGETKPFVIQSPRPLFEVNSFEVAISLFERMNANALLIGGTHPLANRDYSSDLVRPSNHRSLFTLVNQVLMRENNDSPLLSVQCRALGQKIGQQLPAADMLVSFDDGAVVEKSFNYLQKNLITTLLSDNWQLRFVDGSLQTSGYQVGGTPQARYVNASMNKGFSILWVSPLVRSSYKQQRDDDSLSIQFLSLDIPSIDADLFTYIQSLDKTTVQAIKEPILNDLKTYQDTLDIVLLRKLAFYDKSLMRVIDKHSKQAFLLLHNTKGDLVAIGNLNPLDISTQHTTSSEKINRLKMNEFIDTRTARLIFQ